MPKVLEQENLNGPRGATKILLQQTKQSKACPCRDEAKQGKQLAGFLHYMGFVSVKLNFIHMEHTPLLQPTNTKIIKQTGCIKQYHQIVLWTAKILAPSLPRLPARPLLPPPSPTLNSRKKSKNISTQVELDCKDLWERFHQLGTEMFHRCRFVSNTSIMLLLHQEFLRIF